MGVYLYEESADEGLDDVFRQNAVERLSPMCLRNDARLKTIVQDAVFAYGTMAAAITIINWRKQLILASTGLQVQAIPREDSICEVAIQQADVPLVVPDATLDPRLNWKSIVRMEPHVRFYAGAAIVDGAGYPLGALCVFDPSPRHHEVDTFALSMLARNAEAIICGSAAQPRTMALH